MVNRGQLARADESYILVIDEIASFMDGRAIPALRVKADQEEFNLTQQIPSG